MRNMSAKRAYAEAKALCASTIAWERAFPNTKLPKRLLDEPKHHNDVGKALWEFQAALDSANLPYDQVLTSEYNREFVWGTKAQHLTKLAYKPYQNTYNFFRISGRKVCDTIYWYNRAELAGYTGLQPLYKSLVEYFEALAQWNRASELFQPSELTEGPRKGDPDWIFQPGALDFFILQHADTDLP